MVNKTPGDWDFYNPGLWQFSVVDRKAILNLLNPEKDMGFLAFTRIGDGGRQGVYDVIPNTDNGRTAIRLYLPLKTDPSLDDYTMSLPVKKKIKARQKNMQNASGITIRARGNLMDKQPLLP